MYWLPVELKNDIFEMVYVLGSDAMDSRNFIDTKALFSEITEVGNVNNQPAIKYQTKIYLFRKPRSSFNKFWHNQIKGYSEKIK